MCDYTKLESDQDEILQAGVDFLERSKEATGNDKTGCGSKEASSLHPRNTMSVGETVHAMLKKAVKENDVFMSQINDEEKVHFKGHRSKERRGAVWEEDILERDGLLELLKTYAKEKHFRECFF